MTNIHMISHAESCGATLRCCDSLNAGLLPCTSPHLDIISRSPVCTVLAMHGLRQIEAPARPVWPSPWCCAEKGFNVGGTGCR